MPLVSADQQTLTWRIFNQVFWSERHFPQDHPIRTCGLCLYKDVDLEHKYFGCLPTIHPTIIEVIFDDAHFSPALMKGKFISLVEKTFTKNFRQGHTVLDAHKHLQESSSESIGSYKGIQQKDIHFPPNL
ncbi:hypothetical protein DSO57_1014987 [Entomophthora muscae]|uniref:Uncharacterized protein n=1 Tax=Entomophthora muscae TaxID=34485 RepID=A0ACC2URL4_9FUNG|nr:hypothetical protein DSO57_1014987 [Entomophthora muscae]